MTVRKSQLDSESDDSILLQYESLRLQVLNRYLCTIIVIEEDIRDPLHEGQMCNGALRRDIQI